MVSRSSADRHPCVVTALFGTGAPGGTAPTRVRATGAAGWLVAVGLGLILLGLALARWEAAPGPGARQPPRHGPPLASTERVASRISPPNRADIGGRSRTAGEADPGAALRTSAS